MLAFASGNEVARACQQFPCMAEKRLAEPDATGVVVVDEDAWFVREGGRHDQTA